MVVYFIILGGESVPTNKIGQPDNVALRKTNIQVGMRSLHVGTL